MIAGATLVTTPAFAAQHLVRAGDDWSKLKDKVKAGDDIILMPGKHKGATIDGLTGSADKPISIRSADLRVPVVIEADSVGILLRSPRHVRIESVVVMNAKRTAIHIEGTEAAPAEDIRLRSVYVAKTGDHGERDAIRIEHARGVSIDRSRVESWYRAGIHVHASRDVTVTATEWVGGAQSPDLFCVAIDGGSKNVRIDHCKFGLGTGIAVAIGIADTETVPTPPTAEAKPDPNASPTALTTPALADSITIEHCISDHQKRFIALGSCRTLLVRANTILSPVAAWEVAATPKGWCPPTDVTILSNLITWEPGSMQRFSFAATGAEPLGISIEANLWWSIELPAAKSLLGEFVGVVKAPQVLDRDPKLDNYFQPREEAAKSFGRGAP